MQQPKLCSWICIQERRHQLHELVFEHCFPLTLKEGRGHQHTTSTRGRGALMGR